MHRSGLLRLLGLYRQQYPGELPLIDRFVRFVESHPGCFERTLSVGHVTGSAWIVDGDGSSALLTHHRKLDRWLQLGGHADGDPDTAAVALREAREESGLSGLEIEAERIFDLDIHPIPSSGGEPAHAHYDVRWVVRAPERSGLRRSDESKDLAWFEIEKLLAEGDDASLRRMARKWFERRSSSGGAARN